MAEGGAGKCLRVFHGHADFVKSVAFSPDGGYILSSSWDRSFKLWETSTGECLHTFEKGKYDYGVYSVTFSPNGRYVISGSEDRTLKLWELEWEYEFPGWADWDDGARPYIMNFLRLHTPRKGKLFRKPKPTWTEEDFKRLMTNLSYCGYGWLRPEGVRARLKEIRG